MLGNIIIFVVIATIIGGAVAKILKDKKNGSGCASCPYNSSCSTKPPGPTQSLKIVETENEKSQ